LDTGEIAEQEVTAISVERPIESEDDCRICVRRGLDQEAKPKKRQRKMKHADDADE
jgi:hypothetical protein